MLSSPQEVAIFMAEGKNNIGLVENDALEEFLDISKELNSSIRTDEVIKGYQFVKVAIDKFIFLKIKRLTLDSNKAIDFL